MSRVSRRSLLNASVLVLVVSVVLGAIVVAEHATSRPAAPRHVASHDLSTLPAAAQGVVSGAVAADSAAYRVKRSGDRLTAQSAAHGLQERFDGSAVRVTLGTTQLGLSLQAWGYGSSLRSVSPVRPSASANRVSYNRSGLGEWYRNGPLGLEQGFTIYRAPASPASTALTLSIALSGNAQASLAADRQSVNLTRAGHSSLRYAGLVATDAGAHALPSWLELHGGRMLLRVDTRGARYPLRIDPFVQQAKLIGGEEISEGKFGAKFGFAVALSADGNTALVGGHEDKRGRGAAWVFTRLGATWSQQGPKLSGRDECTCGGRFGGSVALSADGNTAMVGGPGDGATKGAAWIFARSGSTWTQQGPKLIAQGENGAAYVGISVALSGDGNTALAGGVGDSDGLGAAWVFTREGTSWSQQAELSGSEEIGKSNLGRWGVALSFDGNTALVGGPGDNNHVGAAWVFTREAASWSQQAKLTGNEGIGAGEFGFGEALSADGNTALIGGPSDNRKLGAAWVFTREGTSWTQQAKLTEVGKVKTKAVDLGRSVALSADGTTALLGAATDDDKVGSALLFTRAGATWSQQPKLTPNEAVGDAQFGRATALSADGNTVLIGGPHDNGNIGAAWVFARETAPRVAALKPTSGPERGGTSVTITGANLGGATSVEFGSTAATSFTVNSNNSITAISPAGSGTVDVTVTTPYGTSATSPADQFSYSVEPPPAVTKIKPAKGPAAGGTAVTITGSGFTGATSVQFGSTPATSYVVDSESQVEAVSPAGTGAVDVTVTTPYGTSLAVAADQFKYKG